MSQPIGVTRISPRTCTVFLCLVAIFYPVTTPASVSAQASSDYFAPGGILHDHLEGIRHRYGFAGWQGRVKAEGKSIRDLVIPRDAFLPVAGTVTIRTPSASSVVSVVQCGKEDAPRKVEVRVDLTDTPARAQEGLLKRIAMATRADVTSDTALAKPGGEFDFGDRCLVSARDGEYAVSFTRANASVWICGLPRSGSTKADIIALARRTDDILVGLLEDTIAPVPAETNAGDDGRQAERLTAEPPLAPDLIQAVAAGDVGELRPFVRSPQPREADQAIRALAKTGPGRAELSGQILEGDLPDYRICEVLTALGSAGTRDAIDFTMRYAQVAKSPKTYCEAINAASKALPPDESLGLWLDEARKLADSRDAPPENLAFVVRGLSLEAVSNGEPKERKPLCDAAGRPDDATLRAAYIAAQGARGSGGAALRDRLGKVLADRLDDADPIDRLRVLRAVVKSGDIRQLSKIRSLLDDSDARVRETAAEGVSDLVGWERPRSAGGETEEQRAGRIRTWVAQVKANSEAAARALEGMERAAAVPALR